MKRLMNVLVTTAGFLNAAGIAIQMEQIATTKNVAGISLPMFGMFLFIQSVFVARGVQNKDTPMIAGMLTSALVTIIVIIQVLVYRT